MNILATSVGSSGDFLPTLAIAAALRRRGHRVRMVTNPFYERQVQRCGLDLVAAGQRSDVFQWVETQPELMDPLKGGLRLVDEFALPHSEEVYRCFQRSGEAERPDVVLTNDVTFGAAWWAMEQGVPFALVHATPLAWSTWHSPVHVSERPLPEFVRRPATALVRAAVIQVLSRRLRRLGRKLGVKLEDCGVAALESAAALRLGAWSPRLRGPARGDPIQGRICGSARASRLGGESGELPEQLRAFLEAGEPPVVVGLGSIFSLISGPMQACLAETCVEIGRRCLVIGHPSQQTFPAGTLAVPHAPHALVFPRAAAVVVHGGAGSTAEALRSGRPVLVTPFAYDQFWMAAQVERLGVGRVVKTRQRTRDGFATALKEVLGDVGIAGRARDSGAAFSEELDGAEAGANAVEEMDSACLV
jgi:rhamnosyltransferase subunit B